MKKRLDLLLLEKGFTDSRTKGVGLIMAGHVLVNDQPQLKPGTMIPQNAQIRLRNLGPAFVSRGAVKLKAALDFFPIQVENKVGADIGASTGGFTQVLLQKGAEKIFAIDVGTNQLSWSIRNNSRVIVREKLNARYLKLADLGQKVDFVTVDVSFISLEKIFPALLEISHKLTDWITLIKPQFEVGRERVGKGGIVTSEKDQWDCIERLTRFAGKIGMVKKGTCESPILGARGNKEFFCHWKCEDP